MKTWIATDTHRGIGASIENGQCVRHVQEVAGVPHTSEWRKGERVRDMDDPPRGLVVATFGGEPARYQNRVDGSSHVAILLARNSDGLLVVDQWVGKRVSERVIKYRGGRGKAVNDGDAYYCLVTEET